MSNRATAVLCACYALMLAWLIWYGFRHDVWAGPRPCEVQVERIPPARESVDVVALPPGAVFELPNGHVFMRATVTRAGYVPPGWETGIPDPPAGWVWCVDLSDGELMKVPTTWRAWPVVRVQVSVHE